MKSLDHNIEEIGWLEARSHFHKSEPELAKIIDELSPDSTFTLFRVSYPFGSMILDKAIIHLPTKGYQSIPISHPEIPSKIKEALSYSNLPLGCIVNEHGIEVFRELQNKLHLIAFFNIGLDLGIWEFFSPPTPFSISAGARSLMLLPKISDSTSHSALQKYGVSSQPPLLPYEQWQIFREMSVSDNFSTKWYCEVIFLTNRWAEKIKQDPAWLKFKHFLLDRVWKQTEHNRNRFLHDEMWESFFNILSARRIKPISYIVDLFKYLLYIAPGSKTGVAYKPADGQEVAGPVNEIIRIYLEEYKLKTYVPTLMLPTHFYDGLKQPVYYPLQIPTYWDTAPKSRDSVSAKRDLNYLIWLMDAFKRELINGNIQVTIPSVHHLFDRVNFDFFHSDGNVNERIKPSSAMPEMDKNLLYMPPSKHKYGERKFADRSSFARACVRISPKQS